MSEITRDRATGLDVSRISDTDDEIIVFFSNGDRLRHRKRPLPETSNAITFLEGQLKEHLATEYAFAHVPKPIYPPEGTVLKQYCVGFDLHQFVADGVGGHTDQLVEVNNGPICGYVPPPAAGTLLGGACVGYDFVGTYADGKGGTYAQVIEKNSTGCGYVPPPVYPAKGTILRKFCSGYNWMAEVADGNGGSTNEVLEANSAEHCDYVPANPNPAAGTVLSNYCENYNWMARVADGNGGSTNQLVEANSVAHCGYTSYPAKGTILDTKCIGFDKYNVVADGSGGSSNVLVETNSTTCGYKEKIVDFSTFPTNLSSNGLGDAHGFTVVQQFLSGMNARVFAIFWLDGTWSTVEWYKSEQFNKRTGRYYKAGYSPSDFDMFVSDELCWIDGKLVAENMSMFRIEGRWYSLPTQKTGNQPYAIMPIWIEAGYSDARDGEVMLDTSPHLTVKYTVKLTVRHRASGQQDSVVLTINVQGTLDSGQYGEPYTAIDQESNYYTAYGAPFPFDYK